MKILYWEINVVEKKKKRKQQQQQKKNESNNEAHANISKMGWKILIYIIYFLCIAWGFKITC